MMRDSFALEPRPAVSAPKGASSITAAVAVATVTIIATAVPGNTFQMTIKRPLLFVFKDQQAGTILFMGTVFQP
jgi:serine protease inhibitor